MRWLAARRAEAGLTQEDVAAHLQKNRSTIAKWETGASSPSSKDLPSIARLYRCSVDDLFLPPELIDERNNPQDVHQSLARSKLDTQSIKNAHTKMEVRI